MSASWFRRYSLSDLRGWLAAVGVVLSEDEIREIVTQSARALSDYIAADGSIVFPTSAHIIYGRKP